MTPDDERLRELAMTGPNPPLDLDKFAELDRQRTPLSGFPGYTVDGDGRVFSLSHNWRGYGTRQLKPSPNYDGYPSVRLTLGKRRIHIAVHRLVAMAFLPPRPSPEHEIRHLNGDKNDSRASNICWGTRAENASDRDRHGRTARGSRVGGSKLTNTYAEEIRLAYRSGAVTQQSLADRYGVCVRTIGGVVRGETWNSTI